MRSLSKRATSHPVPPGALTGCCTRADATASTTWPPPSSASRKDASCAASRGPRSKIPAATLSPCRRRTRPGSQDSSRDAGKPELPSSAFRLRRRVAAVKGVMVILSRRLAHAAINRCHKPGDGDIVVPGLSVAILGTTAVKVPHPEVLPIEWDEVQMLIDEGAKMLDGVTTARAMRAYAGVRPLYDLGAEAQGREMGRNFPVTDHEERDRIAGFTSIVGGKVTTYRLMAERVTDLVARRLGVSTPCT